MRKIRTLRGHSDAVRHLAFSPANGLLASSSDDGTVKIWNPAHGTVLKTFVGHAGAVGSIVFSPDGGKLAWSSGLGDNTISNVSDGREVVSLVGFVDDSWIAITQEGYFVSSSAQAEQNINVRIGNRVFGIGSFREKFFNPDFLKASIAGQAPTKFGAIGNDPLPPFVDVDDLPASTTDPTIKLNVHLADDGGGIGTVRLFLNGAAVLQDGSEPLANGKTTRSYTVPLLDGDNELSAVAFNTDGTVQSNDATVFVTAKLPPVKPVLHAVIVGIQDFKNPAFHLTQAVGDAQLFDQTLEKYAPPEFGKPDIELLITPGETDRQHLIDVLKAMQPRIGPKDVFIFYFASHGEVSQGKYYLVTSNVGSYDRLQTDALGSQELAGLLANIPATKKLVIIDACHSQKLGDAMQLALADQGMNSQAATTILSRGTGLTSLSASATDEEALEGNEKTAGHGFFTYVLVNGLLGKPGTSTKMAVGNGGLVDTFNLADYVDAEVPLLAKSLNSATPQDPTVNKSGAAFPVTRVQ